MRMIAFILAIVILIFSIYCEALDANLVSQETTRKAADILVGSFYSDYELHLFDSFSYYDLDEQRIADIYVYTQNTSWLGKKEKLLRQLYEYSVELKSYEQKITCGSIKSVSMIETSNVDNESIIQIEKYRRLIDGDGDFVSVYVSATTNKMPIWEHKIGLPEIYNIYDIDNIFSNRNSTIPEELVLYYNGPLQVFVKDDTTKKIINIFEDSIEINLDELVNYRFNSVTISDEYLDENMNAWSMLKSNRSRRDIIRQEIQHRNSYEISGTANFRQPDWNISFRHLFPQGGSCSVMSAATTLFQYANEQYWSMLPFTRRNETDSVVPEFVFDYPPGIKSSFEHPHENGNTQLEFGLEDSLIDLAICLQYRFEDGGTSFHGFFPSHWGDRLEVYTNRLRGLDFSYEVRDNALHTSPHSYGEIREQIRLDRPMLLKVTRFNWGHSNNNWPERGDHDVAIVAYDNDHGSALRNSIGVYTNGNSWNIVYWNYANLISTQPFYRTLPWTMKVTPGGSPGEYINPPNLLQPPNNSNRNSGAIDFSWQNVDADLYWIQISSYDDFRSYIVDSYIDNNSTRRVINTPGTFYWRVATRNDDGNWCHFGETFSFIIQGTRPDNPSNLVALALSSSQINLTWTDNSDNEQGFRIERRTGTTGNFTQIAEVPADTTSYSDMGLNPNTTYYYRVRAYNGEGHSDFSNIRHATTHQIPVEPPQAPSNLSADAVSSTRIDLRWRDNSDNEQGFYIYSFLGNAWQQIGQVGANVTNYQSTGLTPDTEYFYRVRAFNAAGNSDMSNVASEFTDPQQIQPPRSPSHLSANTISSNQINLSWRNHADNAQGIRIQRRTGSEGDFVQIDQIGANSTTYQDNELTPNTTYYYRIFSYNAGGNSDYSNTVSGATNPISVQPANGDGTENNPYQIASLANLYWITENTQRWEYHYIQTDDIDAAETSLWFAGNGWQPIGTNLTPFSGSYSGQGYIIDELFIDRNTWSNVGLFGLISEATIDSVGVTNLSIKGYENVGGLVGLASNNATIIGCYTSGKINGGGYYVGGLIGNNQSSIISHSYSTVHVNGYIAVGGLAGTISHNSSVSNCYSTGKVNGNSITGGLIGGNSQSSIVRSFSIGKVTGETHVGGFVGFREMGEGYADTHNYWNTETSEQQNSAGGQGRTTAEMKYPYEGDNYVEWDFDDIWGEGESFLNFGYPYLQSLPIILQPPSVGDGSVDNPYRVSSLEDLYWIGQCNSRWRSNYIQTANIDAAVTRSWNDEQGWQPIGDSRDDFARQFRGTYDGQNHNIDGLYINREHGMVGLFGYARYCRIENLGLTNVNIAGRFNVGSLLGRGQNSTINNCFSSGAVRGIIGAATGDNIGGLVGSQSQVAMNNCYSSCIVSGRDTIGGLIGRAAFRFVTNSYSTGNVSGRRWVGGLVGRLQDVSMTDCYSTGNVTGESYVGGLSGITFFTEQYNVVSFIRNSYSTGDVNGDVFVGGLVGISLRTDINNSYYDYENVLINNENIISIGALDSELYNEWLDNDFNIDINEYLTLNDGYYIINDIDDFRFLIAFGQYSDYSYLLKNNLDLSDYPNLYIPYFTGTFNGNGHTIDGLYSNRGTTTYKGMFAVLNGAKIMNIGITNVNLDGGGGLTSYSVNSTIMKSFVTGNINGNNVEERIGGFASQIFNSKIVNCYSNCNLSNLLITAGGFVGYSYDSTIINCFSVGLIEGEENNYGGLIGWSRNPEITNSYWDIEASGQESSAGGEGRTTVEMTYPYAENTYVDWDFESIWRPDINGNINDGYPIFTWYKSANPNFASNPYPKSDSTNVSVDLDALGWTYEADTTYYSQPVGFRVYFNDIGIFEDDDDFEWIVYDDDESNYNCSDILPDQLEYFTQYYWKVVPTTIEPEQRSKGRNRKSYTARSQLKTRGDANNVSIWTFRTEQDSHPNIATKPIPANDSTDVSVHLERLVWSYVIDSTHVNPVGFKVYFGDTEEFDDDYVWVAFDEDEEIYSTTAILPQNLDYFTNYYWQVIPTTVEPDDNRSIERAKRSNVLSSQRCNFLLRTDAENVPVWKFRTEKYPKPVAAINPFPVNDTTNVSVDIKSLRWSYVIDSTHVNPVGFRIYFGDTEVFDDNFVWVAFDEDEENYSTATALPENLDYFTQYYWKVVPTTIDPEERATDRNRRNSKIVTRYSLLTGCRDADNVPVWTFRTEEDTSVETLEPQMVTKLNGNYPNPFNPYTNIELSICKETQAELVIYNIRGQLVKTLHSGYIQAGEHRLFWNGKDENGRNVGSGVYFYRLKTDHYDQVNKMLLAK